MRVDQINKENKTNKPNSSTKPIIHNIILTDASGSMAGSKYDSAIKSIREELDILSKDTNSDFLYTLVEFDSSRFTRHMFVDKELKSFRPILASGGTPLYNSMGKLFEELEPMIKEGERVLVKIFTDGDDTERGSGKYGSSKIATYIDKLINVNKWTITFNCTEQDKFRLINIGIPESNILAHNNTAEDIERVAKYRTASTMLYSKSVSIGVSVDTLTNNFYTKSIDNEF
jgi:hypothetical protein